MHSGDVHPYASPPSPKNQATAGGDSTQFRRPQNRMLAILCCFLAVLCILVLGSVSVIEWTFRLPFDIDAPTTVAGFNYGYHATLERQMHHTKCKLAYLLSCCTSWFSCCGLGVAAAIAVITESFYSSPGIFFLTYRTPPNPPCLPNRRLTCKFL